MKKASSFFRNATLDSALRKLQDEHRQRLAELIGLGLVLRGSIAPRSRRCTNKKCGCRSDPPRLHGPYVLWTRKVEAKTVTILLTPEETEILGAWNRNMKCLDRIVGEIQEIGFEAARLILESRNPKTRSAARPVAPKKPGNRPNHSS